MLRPSLNFLWGTALIALASSGFSQDTTKFQNSGGDGFRPLFNGKDLEGWKRVNTAESTWTVRDNMLICTGKPIGELRTTKMYQNFILELDWRHMKPRGNAGVFVWADDITAKGVPFHRSIEVQVLENEYGNTRSHTTHGDIFPIHGAKMNPINGRGGSRAFPTENRSRPSPEWNHYRIECVDGRISLAVNGKVVTRGQDCLPRKGYICLESEGGVVHYKNIKINELPDSPLEKEMVAIADRGFRCLYDGIELSNWKTKGKWHANDWRINFVGDERGQLESKHEFGNVEFIVDFRSSNLPTFGFRGVDIDPSKWDKKLLAKGNGWNRLEIEATGGQMRAKINGRQVPRAEKALQSTGPLVIEANGKCELANIYVRELD